MSKRKNKEQYAGVFRTLKSNLPALLTASQDEVVSIISFLSDRAFETHEGGWYFPPLHNYTEQTPLLVCHADTINTHYVSSPFASTTSEFGNDKDIDDCFGCTLDDNELEIARKTIDEVKWQKKHNRNARSSLTTSDIYIEHTVCMLSNRAHPDLVLGGDDRAGCFIAAMLMSKTNYGLLLCKDEEIGSRGAQLITQDAKLCYRIQNNHNCLIEIDRRGSRDVVEYGHGEKLQDIICKNKFWNAATGSCSDISILAPALDLAAVNVSAGYQHEHTHNETIVLADVVTILIELTSTLERLCGYTKDQLRNNEKCLVCGNTVSPQQQIMLDGTEMIFCSEACAFEEGYIKCHACNNWLIVADTERENDSIECPSCESELDLRHYRLESKLKQAREADNPDSRYESRDYLDLFGEPQSFAESVPEKGYAKTRKGFWRTYLPSFFS